jgi:hypothetical protein
MHAIAHRLALTVVGAVALAGLPRAATADVVTGTITPADATVVVVDATGATVAQLKSGPLPVAAPGRQIQGEMPGTPAGWTGLPEPVGTGNRQHRLQVTTAGDGRFRTHRAARTEPAAGPGEDGRLAG